MLILGWNHKNKNIFELFWHGYILDFFQLSNICHFVICYSCIGMLDKSKIQTWSYILNIHIIDVKNRPHI